jgi:hypothetical protein
VPPDVLAQAEQLTLRVEEPSGMQAAGLGESGLPITWAFGQLGEQCGRGPYLACDPGRLDGNCLERAFAADAARGRGVEVALEPRWVERLGCDLDRVRGKVAGRRRALRIDAL